MRIIIGNVQSQAVIGGKDNLLKIDVHEELRKYLRVRVEGYQYSDAYKRRGWDGYQHFMNKSGMFATGFLPKILEYLDELEVPVVELEDQRMNMPYLKQVFDPDIKVWTMRDYQVDIAKKVNNWIEFRGQRIYFPRGIFDAATNSGKNSIMAGIVQNVENSRALMCIHNSLIFKQAVDFFSQIFEVGQIGNGKYTLGRFTIAMNKTLLNRLKESVNVRNDISKFNILFVDESHRAGSKEYARLLTYIDAPMRIFVSGTPLNNDKVGNMISVGLSGLVLGRITNTQLIDEGVSLRPRIHMKLNKSNSKFYSTYEEEYDGVVKFSEDRIRDTIEFIAERKGRYILVAFNEIEHGAFIYERLQAAPELAGLGIEWVHGEDPLRDEKVQGFRDGTTHVLISSTILQEGISIDRINAIAFLIGWTSVIMLKQFLGRGTRADEGESTIDFLDWFDIGKWVGKHSRSRISTWKKEGFEIIPYYDVKTVRHLSNLIG